MNRPVHPVLEPLVQARPVVLVAIPDMTALERVVLSGALGSLDRDRELHYVLPESRAAAMRAAAPALAARSTACGDDAAAFLTALVDRLKPVYCIAPTPLDAWSRTLASTCDAENLACLVLQTAWSDLSCATGLQGPAPFLGCWGPESKEYAVDVLKLLGKRVAPLGAPQHGWLRPVPAAAAKALRTRLGDPSRVLLFCGSAGEFDELAALRHIDRAITRGSLESMRVVYRPQPLAAPADAAARERWQHVVLDTEVMPRDPSNGPAAGEYQAAATLMAAADAIVAPLASAFVIEGLMLEKPVLALAYGGEDAASASAIPSPRLAPLRESSAVILCDDPARLLRDCGRLFKPRWDAKTMRAREKLLDRVVVREPGTYADRLAEFCQTRVDTIGRKMRSQRTGRRATISHSYGADLIAHEYTGVQGDAVVPGYWMHGWLPEYHNVHPALVALHKKEGQVTGYDFAGQIAAEKADAPQWVARADQAAFLAAHGYRRARAIGLPVVYLPAPAVTRVPRSLLVLPPHSHRSHGPDDPLAAAYADAIASVQRRFEHVWVGISEDDLIEGQWVDAFRRVGIGVFTTIDRGDPRTLSRLRRLLSTFDYVTTNGFGSHIAMAAYCGAKVSVFGPFADFPRERMAATHAVKIHPDVLDAACELCSEQAVRRHYPFLFVDPDQASARPEWGAAEVGEPCRVAPAELRRLFGWEAA